jgi:hypothetical protein
MSTAENRGNPAFWVEGNTARALALTERQSWKTSQVGAIDFPPLRDDTIAAPQSLTLPLVEILKRFERAISYCAITIIALVLAAVSVCATSAAITVRDSSLALGELRSRVSIMEHRLEEARRIPPDYQLSTAGIILPIESQNVIWVPLPRTR